MNQRDMCAWLWMLPIVQNGTLRRCENDTERIKVVQDLLNHAAADDMSSEDRVTCVSALAYLKCRLAGCSMTEGKRIPVWKLPVPTPILRSNGKSWG